MKKSEKDRKSRIGLLCIGSRRFKDLGTGTKSGTYVQRIEKETQAILENLEPGATVIYPGDVFDHEGLHHAVGRFSEHEVDCIVVVFHSWAEDNVWVSFLRDSCTDIPLVYYYPSKESIPFDTCDAEDDFVEFLSSGGLVGMLVGSGSIKRNDRTAKVFVGSIARIAGRILTYARLCAIRNILKKSRFGLMPAYNEIMWSTYLDPYQVFRMGPEVTFIGYDELSDISDAIDDSEIAAWKQDLLQSFSVDRQIAKEKFDASIRYSLGLLAIMKKYDLDVLTLNDVDMRLFEKIGLRPGFYPKEISESFSVLCPEADVGIAMAQYVLKLMSSGRQVNIIEPFYIDESHDLFCAGHAGPNDYNGPESKDNVKISIDTRFAKTHYRYAGAPFAWLRIAGGRMTMIHVSQCDGKLKLVASLVDSIDGHHSINGYTHSEFKTVGTDISDFFTQLMVIGTTQHFAVVQGDYIDQLRDFSDICGFSFHHI
ncbi:MAG: hypothetical protein CVV46_16170 [Spirochaetae bacterium HGW-Spirochaetae-2]|jgi:L-arabinose isomerase|nr:MAG: hypothetical protein CVV46_16170 [Spirochaetae bacterium HGW-Spirochaetae-2]